MSKHPSLKEGEQQTDEKVNLVAEEPQIEPAPEPLPPSLDSSSSSSIPPPVSHDTSTNSASTSSTGDPIASQFAQLFTLVGRLSSENEAFKAEVNLELASLKSENQALRRTVEDQGRVIAEVSRAAVPDGHWIWETGKDELERSKGKDGRWLFSLEKYKPNTLRVTAGPPTSLLSLPVELLDMVLSLLHESDLLRLCRVSFQFLERASSYVYRGKEPVSPKAAEVIPFFSARIASTPAPNERIRALLLPSSLTLDDDDDFEIGPLLSTSPPSSLPIDDITLVLDSTDPLACLRKWAPLLRLLDPISIQLGAYNDEEDDQAYSSKPITSFLLAWVDVAFLEHWSSLVSITSFGPLSVPLLGDGMQPFIERVRCNVTKGQTEETRLVSIFSDRPRVGELVEETDLGALLRREKPLDPMRTEMFLWTGLVGDEEEEESEEGEDDDE